MLNHLATKDFLLDDDETAQNDGNLQSSQIETVASVLLYGLEALVPLLSADLLRSHPTTTDRYFSFIAFMVGTYEEEFAARINASAIGGGIGSSSGGQLLNTIVQHALWAAGAIDSCCARLALQVHLYICIMLILNNGNANSN
jgi:hypothetical protein